MVAHEAHALLDQVRFLTLPCLFLRSRAYSSGVEHLAFT